MQNAAQAYGAVAKQIANPRELEADLLLKAASQMQAVYDGWDRKRSDLDLALRYNRKLWTIFLSSVTDAAHGLPVEIGQNVASLGMFVMNQTVTMLSEPKRESLHALININRELAAGLLGRAYISPHRPRSLRCHGRACPGHPRFCLAVSFTIIHGLSSWIIQSR